MPEELKLNNYESIPDEPSFEGGTDPIDPFLLETEPEPPFEPEPADPGFEVDKRKSMISKIHEAENLDKNQEHLKDLQSAARDVQKAIEQTGPIHAKARKERGDITVEQVGNGFSIGSYGVRTRIKFIDEDTISIEGGRGHDLKIDIDIIQGMEQIVKIANIINMVIKKSKDCPEIKNNTTKLGDIKHHRNHIWIKRDVKKSLATIATFPTFEDGIGSTVNLVSYDTLKNLGINPDHFTTYINERKYALSELHKREQKLKGPDYKSSI